MFQNTKYNTSHKLQKYFSLNTDTWKGNEIETKQRNVRSKQNRKKTNGSWPTWRRNTTKSDKEKTNKTYSSSQRFTEFTHANVRIKTYNWVTLLVQEENPATTTKLISIYHREWDMYRFYRILHFHKRREKRKKTGLYTTFVTTDTAADTGKWKLAALCQTTCIILTIDVFAKFFFSFTSPPSNDKSHSTPFVSLNTVAQFLSSSKSTVHAISWHIFPTHFQVNTLLYSEFNTFCFFSFIPLFSVSNCNNTREFVVISCEKFILKGSTSLHSCKSQRTSPLTTSRHKLQTGLWTEHLPRSPQTGKNKGAYQR